MRLRHYLVAGGRRSASHAPRFLLPITISRTPLTPQHPSCFLSVLGSRTPLPPTNPHDKTKSINLGFQIHLDRPPPEGMAVKVKLGSKIGRFGLIVRVGGQLTELLLPLAIA